ncbi:MAG: class I SAM-dependent methyltransferase [Desulfobulbaceae bacterium]|nr:class I SAM-dependent methyltransferase [Desulfobulbaceae bacterium]
MSSRTCFLFVVVVFSVFISGTLSPVQAKPRLEIAVKRQQIRNDYVRFETIIDELDITRGMTIVDIGSGPGYASFLFAEKLEGTGAVYPTDIREDFVGYIDEEAERRGLTNLFPVVVNDTELDDFYGRHHFDIVFVSNVYHAIDNRVEYFRELRKSLNPGAQVVFILYNQVPLFTVDDFYETEGIIGFLSQAGDDDPFVRYLSDETKLLVAEKTATRKLEKRLVEDFNQMLLNPHFFRDFYDGSYFRKDMFDAAERELANWLLMVLKEDGALEAPVDQLDAKTMRRVIKFNRLFFQSRFGDYLANNAMGAYVPAGDANRHTSKYEMLRELNAAGYKFVKEVRLSAYFDGIIMVPVTP